MGALMASFLADELLMSHGKIRVMLWRDPLRLVECTGSKLPSSCSGDDAGHFVVPPAWRIYWECVPGMLVARGPV